MKTFKRSQVINGSIKDVWDFITSSNFMEALRGDRVLIQDVANQSDNLYKGQIMNYDLEDKTPLKSRLTIEISELKPYSYLLKSQIVGPFKDYKHHHYFTEIDENHVKLEDVIEYTLPVGLWSMFKHRFWFSRRINQVLDYRAELIERNFEG